MPCSSLSFVVLPVTSRACSEGPRRVFFTFGEYYPRLSASPGAPFPKIDFPSIKFFDASQEPSNLEVPLFSAEEP